MKRIFLSVLLISTFYQISNAKAQEDVAKNKESALSAEKKSAVDKSLKEKKEDKEATKDVAEKATKDDKEVVKDATQKATKDIKEIKKAQTEAKKSHKGKIVGMQRGHAGVSIKPSGDKDKRNIYSFETTYEVGAGYFVTDRVRIEGFVGVGIGGSVASSPEDSITSSSSSSLFSGSTGGYGIIIPVELVASYSITNFVNWDKDIEVFGSIGYDFPVWNNPVKKLNLSVGLQLGRYMGLRLTYSPYANFRNPDVSVGGITVKAKETDSFYLLGLSLSYRI